MAQMRMKLRFKLHWWVRPIMFAAAWGAYPLLWLLGEEATDRYIEALTALLLRCGIGRCSVEGADHEAALE